MLRHVALARTDVSEERSSSIIRVTRIGDLGTASHSSVTSVIKRATRRNIPEDGILHNYRDENLKPYKLMSIPFRYIRVFATINL
jgi:hypothetical protein